MNLITIQHKTVLNTLNTTGVYKADLNRAASNLNGDFMKFIA